MPVLALGPGLPDRHYPAAASSLLTYAQRQLAELDIPGS